ncbi:MAG: ABC transporter permease [Deltaproteobacteria bacterium]|nr:ABC transporter permease [Deltaproteobacteria bacterium]
MSAYIFRRLLMLVPLLIGITVVSFLILQLVPGDPARIIAGMDADETAVQEVRSQLGLDRPLIHQYLSFMGQVVRGDFGRSIRTGRPVLEEVGRSFPLTACLAGASIVIAFLLGVPAGAAAAWQQNRTLDYALMGLVLLGVSTPTFWSGLLLILAFSLALGWLPSGGAGGLSHLLLPALTLAAPAAAVTARMTRSSMLEVLGQDFIRTARAKGQSEFKVIVGHGLRNALVPTVTVVGLQFGYLLGGAVLVETIFTWPGLGWLIVNAIFARDYPVVQAGVMLFAFCFVLVNLLVDVLYAYLDPRITYD